MNQNQFERYSSKVKRVNVPLPTFNYVHKSWISNRREDKMVGFLIGRDRIIEKLKSWLTKEKTDGGSYLITGYRGMGKTSFVDSVIYELVGEAGFWDNLVGLFLFMYIGVVSCLLAYGKLRDYELFAYIGIPVCIMVVIAICKRFYLEELWKKTTFRLKTGVRYIARNKRLYNFGTMIKIMCKAWIKLSPKEWERINRHVNGRDVKAKRYSHISVNVNLGQEILDERSILCVLSSQLHDKYKSYIFSPIANIEMWMMYMLAIVLGIILCPVIDMDESDGISLFYIIRERIDENGIWIYWCGMALILMGLLWHQIHSLSSLLILSKRINAQLVRERGAKIEKADVSLGLNTRYTYPIASTRDIESQLITILDRIDRFPIHPTFYFIFDELDKIETPLQQGESMPPEFTNEKYLTTGGTSRKRKYTVMHLLANMKFFTTTAKAKFIFIAGREMYDGYLADLTDRESAISSLFNGVIYVESFCKNEKSERDVMYNAETFISRQLLPTGYVKDRVIDKYIECKLNDTEYVNIDINLKMYYEYLVNCYADFVLNNVADANACQRQMNEVRACIDKTIGLLYHFSAYLYHLSNGSPKKMYMTFESFVRPLKNGAEFKLTKDLKSPMEGKDLDIHIPKKCRYLLSFSEKEQRIIGFVHYISFPVNQIITASDQFGDKLLVSASFLINHLYKHHSGGFSWRNIEQIPELLEVYKIPEFRGFISSILSYLLQTHIIQIPCGLYQYKFRKQISEEISLASKISEEVSALFNFTLDESQSVKRHYYELQQSHIALLRKEKVASPHSIAGIHHILGDMYLEDEEYNNAIFEYQTAVQILIKTYKDSVEDPHNATVMQAYIRNMLKLGMAFEKRRTYASAYNTYNEIIDRLFRFREFKEKGLGLTLHVKPKAEWPYEDAILYEKSSQKEQDQTAYNPIKKANEQTKENLTYRTKGNWLITDFSYQMNPERHSVIQRLGMLEDTKIVYQALLAKLFINEKIELGGITRMNLDTIEGEFHYIHLTTNEKQKFLISTDFFRRLGDIMFYKNGLIGFNYNLADSKTKVERDNTINGKVMQESFVESLYYRAFNIQTELSRFCKSKNRYEWYGKLLKEARFLNVRDFRKMQECNENKEVELQCKEEKDLDIQNTFNEFWQQEHLWKRIKKLPLDEIEECNQRRENMWKLNKTMPCYACKYYNRSLRIIMRNLCDMDVEIIDNGKKRESRAITILRQIVISGSAKSMRQNYMIQMGEVLDCLGNTLLSCVSLEKNRFDEMISSRFLAKFLHDVNKINRNLDKKKNVKDYRLLEEAPIKMSKLETAILYFWEASICFRYGREMKKASGSMKKILRVLQNYMRVAERILNKATRVRCKVCIGEYLNEIKNRLVKQCLICLYSHYNFINLIEIQRLKWIFYVQMYENISLSRLSLFPDVEEIMLIYYDLIRLCYVDNKYLSDKKIKPSAVEILNNVRSDIKNYSRDKKEKIQDSDFTWKNIEKRNEDFNKRLIGIYNNLSMGCLRHENTMYEKVLSLRAKTMLNQHILFLSFPALKEIRKYSDYIKVFCSIFTTGLYNCKGYDATWKDFFPNIDFNDNNTKSEEEQIGEKLKLLEFLIRDSIYCLTSILESITPHSSTTLFTNTFMGNIYQSLNYWNIMFDALYGYYKTFDEEWSEDQICAYRDGQRELLYMNYDGLNSKGCPASKRCLKKDEVPQTDEERAPLYVDTIEDSDDIQMKWPSRCPHYSTTQCDYKRNEYEEANKAIKDYLKNNNMDFDKYRRIYRNIWERRNISDRFFASVLQEINKPNIQYTLTNYSGEMALKSYRMAKELHREGRAYKEMIAKMYFLDDDLKNDTIQFDLALERFKINSGLIDKRIGEIMQFFSNSIYDIESFCTDNEAQLPLRNRFQDIFWNVSPKDEAYTPQS